MSPVKILIVEDEAIVATDLAESLESGGYQIAATAATGKAAVAAFEKNEVDVVLMDIHLRGDLDGIETATALQKIRPTPLIYLTGQTDPPTVERAKKTYPSAYLAKPFDERNLFLAIELAMHNFAFQKTETPANPSEKTTERPTTGQLTADNILRNDNGVFIKQNYKFVKFSPDELLFLRADGSHTDLITPRHKYSLRLSLQQVLERLRLPNVVRVHKSFAVNTRNIESFNDQEITVGSAVVPIGAAFRDDFLSSFQFS